MSAAIAANRNNTWWVYILLCEGGRFYCGISNNLESRFKVHLSGKGAVFTKINRPVSILAAKAFESHHQAAKVERQLKISARSVRARWAQDNQLER